MAATKDIATILAQRDQNKYSDIIARAANNGYHDHKFNKIPGHPEYGECMCPKMQLVADLVIHPELDDIRNQVMEGVYDEPADAQDQEEMRGWLIQDEAPDEMFDQLGFKRATNAERMAGRPINN